MNGEEGRRGSFEVTVSVDGRPAYLVWSKLSKGAFPDWAQLGAEMGAFVASGAAPPTWARLA